MISLIEALNFRCLRYIHQPLGPFHILVGPNASGKTTFLDVVAVLGQLISEGLESAINERTNNFQDLVWARSNKGIELAVEALIPATLSEKINNTQYNTIRYEIGLGIDPETHEISILAEKALLKNNQPKTIMQRTLFPVEIVSPNSILSPDKLRGARTVVKKMPGGNDNFYSEVYKESGKGWVAAFKLGTRKSALGNLPEDESQFPVTTWFKRLITEGVQKFILNSILIRKASPPGQVRGFKPDGSNLPWVIDTLQKKDPDHFKDWIAHLKTALPDLQDIRIIERSDDKHRYMVLCYDGNLEVPSWVASDGTLRLLALTLPAYLPVLEGIYLIEEPENGIHPRAVETMFQSLSSVYNAQVLMATHSPVILSVAEAKDVLCFAKTTEGATDIVRGSEHPALKEWRGETNLGVLFAGGVLG